MNSSISVINSIDSRFSSAEVNDFNDPITKNNLHATSDVKPKIVYDRKEISYNLISTEFMITDQSYLFDHHSVKSSEPVVPNNLVDTYFKASHITLSEASLAGGGYPGNGSPEDPYIVEGYNITGDSTLLAIESVSSHLIFRNNILTQAGQGGGVLPVIINNSANVTIYNNTITDCSNDAIHVIDSHDITIQSNTLVNNLNEGINLYRSFNNSIFANTIYNNTGSGITLNNANQTIIESNYLLNNTMSGIHVTFSNDNSLTNNTIIGSDDYGIDCIQSARNNIMNNTILKSYIYGLNFLESNQNNLTGNLIELSRSYGMRMRYSNFNTISNNTIKTSEFDAIRMESSCNNSLISNLITENGDSGILILRSNDTILQYNQLKFNQGRAGGHNIDVEGSSNVKLFANQMVGSGLSIQGTVLEHFNAESIKGNLVNGKSLVVLLQISEFAFPYNAGQLLVIDSHNLMLSNQKLPSILFGMVSNITINHNELTNLTSSLQISGSSNIKIYDNYIHNNTHTGIDISNSEYIEIRNNQIEDHPDGDAIRVKSSSNTEIFRNRISYAGNGVFLTEDSSENDIFENYFQNCSTAVSLLDTANNTISSNRIYNSTVGVGTTYVSGQNQVIYNEIHNSQSGISMTQTSNLVIRSNSINNSFYGIIALISSQNHMAYNNIYNSESVGIGIIAYPSLGMNSNDNYIISNNFYNNYASGSSQAFDSGENNVFRNNYWDDWTGPDVNSDNIVDSPYVIDGLNYTDQSPRVSPYVDDLVPIIEYSGESTFELKSTKIIKWKVSDANPYKYNVTIDGYLRFDTAFWSNGTISFDISDLWLGDHTISITFYDFAGNNSTHTITVTIYLDDDQVPNLEGPDDLTYALGSTGHQINWVITDVNPDVYNITLDGELYIGDTEWTNGTVTIDVDGLSLGIHHFLITVYDLNGNQAQNTVQVTVYEMSTTSSTTRSTASSTSGMFTTSSTSNEKDSNSNTDNISEINPIFFRISPLLLLLPLLGRWFFINNKDN